MKSSASCLALLLATLSLGNALSMSAQTNSVSPAEMQAIYDAVKTPFKYGIVLNPPPGKKIDCPNVFRHENRWYMVYVQQEDKPAGYTTQLATSTNLLDWEPLGTILDRGQTNTWDHANAGGGIALFDTEWNGSNGLQTHEGQYWLSYIGGAKFGYETTPLAIGVAHAADPTKAQPWTKLPAPVLQVSDPDARAQETETLYKSYIFKDERRTLGAPFVMFYNAKPNRGSEQIFAATSHDLKTWKRYGPGTALENLPPAGLKHGVISGDPQIVRINELWVMFYFGAFWKEGAFDTFAASRDLVNWTKWNGQDLIKPSEAWDTPFAHKPWLLKHDGVVYHFYCSVGGKDQHRAIALATSKDLRRR